MRRALQLAGVLLLGVALGFCDQKTTPKEPPPPPRPAAKANAGKGGVPKNLPKGSGRIINPANPATALLRMTPEERERALEQLPPQRQEQARRFFESFDKLPKDQQALQLRRLEWFQQQPPEKQAQVRELIRASNQLPPARRAAVGRALTMLQSMPDAQRQAVLNRPAFQARFSPEELRIVRGLADVFVPPF
ncbi:MAG TPA: DUF3106 domain-containing protein [Bryobacteraceae bacterium]|nr:DUF3106 domain-containing protein [Bryobacteraceae bacterium]